MAYAAALVLGLALLWLGWSPEPTDQTWLIAGALALGFAIIAALSMRIVDQEGAPYFRAPLLSVVALRNARAMVGIVLDVARRAFAADPKLHPALVRFRVQPGAEAQRADFANMAALSMGAVAVDVEAESLLIHVLVEDDADEAELRALEARVRGRGA